MIFIVLMYALFALSVTISKILVEHYTNFTFLTGSRMTLAGLILLAYQYFAPHERFKFKIKHLALYAEIVIIGMYMANMCRFYALSHMPSSKLSFIYNLSPFFSALYAYILFKDRLTRRQWVGLVIGFLGMIPLLMYRAPEEMALAQLAWISWPELVALCAVACHSYNWIALRKLVKEKNYAPTMVNGLGMLAGGILALGTAAVFNATGAKVCPMVKDLWPFLGLLAGVIFVSNILAHNMYGFLLKTHNPTFLSFAGFLCPLFNALFSWILLGEKVTWHFYSSCVIVFGGLYLFYRDEIKKHEPSKAQVAQSR